MSMTRRSLVSGTALAAAAAALPLEISKADDAPPMGASDEITAILDIMERQIGLMRKHLAERESKPAETREAFRLQAAVLDHRAQSFAARARVLKQLSVGQSLAEQRAEHERRRLAARDAGYEARNRLHNIVGYSDLIADGECSPGSQQLYADFVARECRHLESDIDRVLNLIA